MSSTSRILGAGLLFGIGLAACGGGGSDRAAVAEEPLNVDYSTLRLAESRELPLQYAANDEQILAPLRNGVRLATRHFSAPPGVITLTGNAAQYSGTTVQVAGVDEADAVKYDGSYIYAVRPQTATPQSTLPQRAQNVLAITRTDAATAKAELISNYVIEGEQSMPPLLYQSPASGGRAEYLVAVSQDYSGWFTSLPVAGLVVQPDSTTVQLLDVRDPQHVSQAWKLRIDGWLNASRLIGDTLYLVSSYRPRVADLIVPADTLEKQQANERRIRSSTSEQLLPHYRVDGGANLPLVTGRGCLIAQQLPSNESYTDLLVIAAINVRARRLSVVNCLSTNVNGVYMATNSLYVAGTRVTEDGTTSTVLHKFAIADGQMSYRATGAVPGTVGWPNGSYFMDEHNGDLRILTSRSLEHRLTVLRESGKSLVSVATLPDASRPERIGKPGESVYAVRFVGDRAYVVTFRLTDPLYVIDLRDPVNPAIAGQLEIPGVSSYLRPVGPYVLSVGQDATNGRRTGVKVELFDVRDITHPQSLGVQLFGKTGTWSEALNDPHALAFLEKTGADASLRLALPIDVYDTPVDDAALYGWTYSGLHVLEVSGIEGATPQLKLQGVIKTAERGNSTSSPYVYPRRAVLHDDAVFGVNGEQVLARRWQDLP